VIQNTDPGKGVVNTTITLIKKKGIVEHYLKEVLAKSDLLSSLEILEYLDDEKTNPQKRRSLDEIEWEITAIKAKIAEIYQRYEQNDRDLEERNRQLEECSRNLGKCTNVNKELVRALEEHNQNIEANFNALAGAATVVSKDGVTELNRPELGQVLSINERTNGVDGKVVNTTDSLLRASASRGGSDMSASYGPGVPSIVTEAESPASSNILTRGMGIIGSGFGAFFSSQSAPPGSAPSSSSLPSAPEVSEDERRELSDSIRPATSGVMDTDTGPLLAHSTRLDVSGDPYLITETTTAPGAGAVVYVDPSSGIPVGYVPDDIIYGPSRELPDSTSADSIPTGEDAAGPSGSHPPYAEPSSDTPVPAFHTDFPPSSSSIGVDLSSNEEVYGIIDPSGHYKYRPFDREYKALVDERCNKHKKKDECMKDPTCVFFKGKCRTPEDAAVQRHLMIKTDGTNAASIDFRKINVAALNKDVDAFFANTDNTPDINNWVKTHKEKGGWARIGHDSEKKN